VQVPVLFPVLCVAGALSDAEFEAAKQKLLG
jgi:hypothetical protein